MSGYSSALYSVFSKESGANCHVLWDLHPYSSESRSLLAAHDGTRRKDKGEDMQDSRRALQDALSFFSSLAPPPYLIK